jgi:hypothetical protein
MNNHRPIILKGWNDYSFGTKIASKSWKATYEKQSRLSVTMKEVIILTLHQSNWSIPLYTIYYYLCLQINTNIGVIVI